MKVVAKRFRVLGILALVAVLAFLFVPKAVQAAPGDWSWERVSPLSWGEPGGNEGDMMTGYQNDSETYDGDVWIGGTRPDGDPILWRYDLNGDKSWSDAMPATSQFTFTVSSMTTDDDNLYVATSNNFGSQVWTYNGTTWSNDAAFEAIDFESTFDIIDFNGSLCVYGWKDNAPVLHCKEDGAWVDTNIGGSGPSQVISSFSGMAVADNHLYVSGHDGSYTQIWEYNGNQTWSVLSTPFTGSGQDWEISDMITNTNGQLTAAVFNGFAGTARVYAYSEGGWYQLGSGNYLNQTEGTIHYYPKLTNYDGGLVLGASNYDTGSKFYQLGNDGWERRNEDFFGQTPDNDGFNPTLVKAITSVNDQIFASTAAPSEGDFFNQVWASEVEAPDPDTDSDGDGISDEIEAAGPNGGDANNDNTPDSEQANVASFVNPVSGQYHSIVTDCESLTNLMSGAESSDPADADYDYPAGLTRFHANCQVGATAHFEQYFYGIEGNNTFVMRKWENDYETMEEITFEGVPVDGQIVFRASYDITDGERYDEDGEANGVIVDPAGPATPVSASSGNNSSGSNNTTNSLAGTGQSVWIVIASALGLVTLGSIIAAGSRRRSKE